MFDARRTAVIEKEWRVQATLRELGVTPEILKSALEAGLARAELCTPNHPPNFPGTTLWAEAVRSLRDQLVPQGWHPNDAANFPTVVRDDGALGIAVARGNADTGRAEGRPTTRHARGPITHQAVERNAYLPFDDFPPVRDASAPIWLLLHNRADGELRSELSFPVSIDRSGFVGAWGARLILAPIDLTPGPAAVHLDEDPVAPDVAVGRRP